MRSRSSSSCRADWRCPEAPSSSPRADSGRWHRASPVRPATWRPSSAWHRSRVRRRGLELLQRLGIELAQLREQVLELTRLRRRLGRRQLVRARCSTAARPASSAARATARASSWRRLARPATSIPVAVAEPRRTYRQRNRQTDGRDHHHGRRRAGARRRRRTVQLAPVHASRTRSRPRGRDAVPSRRRGPHARAEPRRAAQFATEPGIGVEAAGDLILDRTHTATQVLDQCQTDGARRENRPPGPAAANPAIVFRPPRAVPRAATAGRDPPDQIARYRACAAGDRRRRCSWTRCRSRIGRNRGRSLRVYDTRSRHDFRTRRRPRLENAKSVA